MTKINLNRLEFEWRRIRQIPLPTLVGKATAKLLGLGLGLTLLPVTVLLHLLGYRHVTIFTDRIGHLALEPDCLLKEQALGTIPHRKWIMLAPPSRVANEHLLTYWQPHFHIVHNYFACFLLASMSRWGLMRYDISHYARAIGKAQAAYRIYSEWGGRLPTLNLTPEDEAWGKEMLQSLGVPEGAWFVCAHAREAGFSPIDEELHKHRNSRIGNLAEAMREVIRRGGWIIRMGDSSMHTLSSMDKVIDYAHHTLKSDRLDIVLCAKAKFFLGNTSGIAYVSSVFGVPCALANLIPVATLGFNSSDISIPKLIQSQTDHRYMNFDEILGSDIANYQYASQYDARGLAVIENSSADICLLVTEMLDRLEGRFVETRQDRERQAAIRNLFTKDHYAFCSASGLSTLFLRAHTELLPEPIPAKETVAARLGSALNAPIGP